MIVVSTETPGLLSDSARQQRKKFDLPLEGLRGFAALIVVLSHAFMNSQRSSFGVDSKFIPNAAYEISFVGHVSVLIFFVLSGYVIGISHRKQFAKGDTIRFYKKRLLRIFPIYLIAVLFSILVSPERDSIPTILGHLVFLQGSFVGLLKANPALWSLSCEIFYYLLFPIFRIGKIKLTTSLAFVVLSSTVFYFIPNFPSWISGYLAGWTFWLVGLHLSEAKKGEIKSLPFVSLYSLLASTAILAPGAVLIHGLHLFSRDASTVSALDLALLPAVSFVFCLVSGRKLELQSWIAGAAILILFGQIAILFKMHLLWATPDRRVAIALLLIGLLCLPLRFSRDSLSKLAPVGKISYALYVLHMPMLILIRFHGPEPLNSTGLVFVAIFCAYLLATFFLSWILETKFQTSLRRLLLQPKN